MSALDSYSSVGDGSCDTFGDKQASHHPTVPEIISLVDNPDKHFSDAPGLITDSHTNFNCNVGVNISEEFSMDCISEVIENPESAAGRPFQLMNDDIIGAPTVDEKVCCLSGIQEFDTLDEVLKDSIVEVGEINMVSHLSHDIEGTGRSLNEIESNLNTKEKGPSTEFTRVEEVIGFTSSVELIKRDLFNGEDIPGVAEVFPEVIDCVLKKCKHDSVLKVAPSCTPNIQAIDESILFQSSSVSEIGNGNSKEVECIPPINDFNKIVNGNTEKKIRRKNKGAKKMLEPNEMQNLSIPMIVSSGSKRVYPRAHLEAWRFIDIEGQNKFWNEVYSAFGPVVTGEYNNLTKNTKHKAVNINRVGLHQHFTKKEEAPAIHGAVIGLKGVNKAEIGNLEAFDSEYVYSANINEKNYGYATDKDAFIEDDDEEYGTIMRPAFLVEGDPNFESGPPEDGLEYLRRVRWETKRIPKVKVAKLELNSIVNKEQTAYMPSIPDIAHCSDHLLPSKTWEDAFLSNFSDLRLALQEPHDVSSLKLKFSFSNELFNVEIFNSVVAMEFAARAIALRKHIKTLEVMGSDDLVWLFALCAVVDVPLDADTCASLRCLLRKCAALRAAKSDPDDELAMLNVLITISGRYFGQLEK